MNLYISLMLLIKERVKKLKIKMRKKYYIKNKE